jgi:hypothetical protein
LPARIDDDYYIHFGGRSLIYSLRGNHRNGHSCCVCVAGSLVRELGDSSHEEEEEAGKMVNGTTRLSECNEIIYTRYIMLIGAFELELIAECWGASTSVYVTVVSKFKFRNPQTR